MSGIGNVAGIDRVKNEKLQRPDDISGVFNVAGFFEAVERNGLDIIVAVERADDEEGGVGVALEFFEFANRVVNAKFSRILGRRNNLKIVKTNDRSFLFIRAERFE